MKTIGIVGGVASGKSTVAKMLVELGAGILDADRTGHAVINEDADVRAAILKRWGDAVFTAEGKIDRAAVAARVFAEDGRRDPELQFLQELLHPRIGVRLQEMGEKFDAAGKPAVVLDAPLLIEAGWKPFCDLVVMVDSPAKFASSVPNIAAGLKRISTTAKPPRSHWTKNAACPMRSPPTPAPRPIFAMQSNISGRNTLCPTRHLRPPLSARLVIPAQAGIDDGAGLPRARKSR